MRIEADVWVVTPPLPRSAAVQRGEAVTGRPVLNSAYSDVGEFQTLRVERIVADVRG